MGMPHLSVPATGSSCRIGGDSSTACGGASGRLCGGRENAVWLINVWGPEKVEMIPHRPMIGGVKRLPQTHAVDRGGAQTLILSVAGYFYMLLLKQFLCKLDVPLCFV